jgi:hypothetical protein
MLEIIVVKAIHDMDAGVWLVESSDGFYLTTADGFVKRRF